MKEIFIDSIIYPDRYLVGNKGTVISKRTGKERKQGIDKYGYPYLRLHKNGDSKYTTIHRLVALSFIPNPENKTTVNHKDGVKTNNDVENLEWSTVQENTQHSYANGLQKPLRGEEVPWSKYTEEQIHSVCRLLEEGLSNTCIEEKTGVKSRTVQSVKNGDNWTHVSKRYTFPDRRFNK